MKRFGDLTFYRFVAAGGLNTGLTYLIYLALLSLMPYALAYTATFILGIATGYFLNARFVYRKDAEIRTAAAYFLIYLFNYLLGISLLYIFVDLCTIPKEAAPIGVVALSVPIIYLLTRSFFLRKPRHD